MISSKGRPSSRIVRPSGCAEIALKALAAVAGVDRFVLALAQGGREDHVGLAVRIGDDPMTPEQFRGFGFPGADDLGNMFQYNRDFAEDFRAPRDVDATRRLNPRLQSFAQWLQSNAKRIPVA